MAKLNKFKINWSDEENDESEDVFEEQKPSESSVNFADILSQEKESFITHELKVGEKIKGRIVKLSEADDVFVDVDSKIPAIISRIDLLDSESGSLLYKEGDLIEAFIVSTNSDSIYLSNSLSHKVARASVLEEAWHSKIPVKAKILAVNKGGYDLEVMGHSAFCPLSQIESYFVENPEVYLGKQLEFLVVSYNKKKCVLSRRDYLEQKARKRIHELFEQLDEEPEVDGEVIALKDFGAIISLGGLQAFLHISEISFSHVEDISDYLTIGQRIRAKVIDITGDFSSKKLPRVSLSMKACEEDPWISLSQDFVQGGTYKAKVVRLCPFGAFVSLRPGIDGLIHISEMSWIKKVRKPEEILSLKDIVTVRVLELDPFKRKISLTLKAVEDDPWLKLSHNFPVGSEHTVEVFRLKSFGALVILKEGVLALIPRSDLQKKFGQAYRKKSSPPNKLTVIIREVDKDQKKILLGFPDVEEQQSSSHDFKEYIKSDSLEEAIETTSPEEKSQAFSSVKDRNKEVSPKYTLGSFIDAAFEEKKKKRK